MEDVLAILLAGGAGERLHPLTAQVAKPAVPFGGTYRIIDFTLSNCINSDVRRVFILTQYKALELNRHIRHGWNILSPELGEYIEVIPPMKRIHSGWYLGTADAVFQNSHSIQSENPPETLILSGDHIYKMNYREMMDWHRRHEADVTVATIQVSPADASRFGVARIDSEHRITGWEEKPLHGKPEPSIFNSSMVSASMGVYAFRTDVLLGALEGDANETGSTHDFGRDVIPKLIEKVRVIAYDFRDLNDKSIAYWRDVGTVESYYDANMDLVSVTPEFNLYDKKWPIHTRLEQRPPAKFVFAQEGRRMGVAIDSIVSAGCIISGGRVIRSVLSPGVRVNSYCEIENSILLHNVEAGRYSRIRNAILDANVSIPEGSLIGFDEAEDRGKGYHVTERGITVVGTGQPNYATITE